MNREMKTTAIFAAVAAVSLGLAFFFRPGAIRSESELSEDLKGKNVFKDFDPEKATTFRIVKFNEELATLSQLELAKDPKSEAWTLPSSDGYPADSAEQISQALAPLTELTVLDTQSTMRGEQEYYGVVEPKEDMVAASSGVGMLIRVSGKNNEVLADLIIGKPVPKTTNQFYVRRPAEDAINIVEIKTDPYSTSFDKWIKGEILSVRSMDIEYVGLRDYAIVPVENGYGLGRNFDADLDYKDNKWALQKFVDFKVEGNPETNQVPDGKKLGETALNDLRNSVQNLKIVNVRRKPAGLAANLKAEESLMKNPESRKSLQSQGFFPMESGEVFAAGGELIVGAKDGVRYLLRFGNNVLSSAALEEEAKDKSSDEQKKEGAEGLRRYLLVTAQVDESKFPVPELKPVPETVEEMLAAEAAEKAKKEPAPTAPPAETKPAEPTSNETPASPENTPEQPKPETAETPRPESPDAPKAEEPIPTTEEPKVEPSNEPSTEPATPPADNPPKDQDNCGPALEGDDQEQDKPAGDGTSTPEKPSTEAENQVAKPEGKTELAPSRQETPEELKERLQFLQETIKKENQRLLDAHNEALKKARAKALEMNAGFADWYYVVNESVYTKLRVSREQLFVAPDAKADVSNPGADLQLPPGFGPGN